ncbi:MAG: hypothetical protein Q7J77_01610 [Undibacterium sp.]|nr:hypothetical protein [Undibacterium sp.]
MRVSSHAGLQAAWIVRVGGMLISIFRLGNYSACDENSLGLLNQSRFAVPGGPVQRLSVRKWLDGVGRLPYKERYE